MAPSPAPRVLHVTAQRPGWTGSGVTLEALVRGGEARGLEQAVLCGLPAGEPVPDVGGLPPERVHAVRFGPGGDLPFDVVGMSDVMPYPNRVWSTLTAEELAAYRAAFDRRLEEVAEAFRPDLVHVHHAWLVASRVTAVLPGLPTVVHGHATGLRQAQLCPHLWDEVREGVRRADAFALLHGEHVRAYGEAFGVEPARLHAVGAGYRDEVFTHDPDHAPDPGRVVFVGKHSAAKGLPWLLDAADLLRARGWDGELVVVGSGSGPEAEALGRRLGGLGHVRVTGRLEHDHQVAHELRGAAAFVLPSLYEGLPLVLAEAAASGARPVATALPGVVDGLHPHLGDELELVDLPRLEGPDRVAEGEGPAFAARIAEALERALARGPLGARGGELTRGLTWAGVSDRVRAVWDRARAGTPPAG